LKRERMLMTAIDLNDPNWRRFSRDDTKALHVWPNQLWYNNVENLGALVVFKRNYEEYAVSQAGLQYVLKAHLEERVVGHVVLACGENWKPQFVAEKDVAAVAAILKGVSPREGPYGPYWWLRADFTLDSDDRPF
jgi:hypothetical protein